MKTRTLILAPMALLFILLMVLVLLVSSVDINRFKPQIEATVASNSNVLLQIDGDLDWQLFPSLAIKAGSSKIYLEQITDEPFASISNFELQADLWALLAGNLQSETLRVDSLNLNLYSDNNGGNWQRLRFGNGERAQNAGQVDGEPTQASGNTPAITLDTLFLNNIAVKHLDLVNDRQQTFLLQSLDASGLNLSGEPFTVELRASARDADFGIADIELEAAIAYNTGTGLLSVRELEAGADWARQEGIETLAVVAQAMLDYDVAHSHILAMQTTIELEDSKLSFAGKATGKESAALEGKLSLSTNSINQLLNSLGQSAIATTDPGVFGRASLQSPVRYQQNRIELNKLEAKLDDSTLNGSLVYIANDNKQPDVNIDLHLDTIDIDRYLPPALPEREESVDTALTSGDTSANSDDLPLELLNRANGSIMFQAKQLSASGLSMHHFSMRSTLASGRLALHSLDADIYQGKLAITGTLDASPGRAATLQINQQLQGVQIAPLLKDLEVQQALSGTIAANANLSMQGNSISRWIKSLAGNTTFTMTDGTYHSTNIEHSVCRAIAGIRNERLTARWPTVTRFREIKGAIDWHRGKGDISQLYGGLDVFSVSGSGSINLPKMRYNIDLNANLHGDVAAFDPGCEINEKYRDIQWPLECNGDSSGNDCGIDNKRLNKAVREAAKKDLKRQAEKKLEDKLGEEFRGLLDGLLR